MIMAVKNYRDPSPEELLKERLKSVHCVRNGLKRLIESSGQGIDDNRNADFDKASAFVRDRTKLMTMLDLLQSTDAWDEYVDETSQAWIRKNLG